MWMAVLVARAAAGSVAGIASVGLSSSQGARWLLVPAVAALVAGLVLPLLLNSISGRTIGNLPALAAAVVGEALPVVIGLAPTRGGFPTVLLVLVGWVISVVAMAWLADTLSRPNTTRPTAS